MPQIRKRARHDPAPSRLKYRMQRWMLTPGIRFALRAGVPFVMVFALTTGFLAEEGRRERLALFVTELRASIEERPEFMVSLMAIDGAALDLAQDIRTVVPLDFPLSSFDLDLVQIREAIVSLDPVKSANVRIRPGGVLQVDVTERKPVVAWRTRSGLKLLDENGIRVGSITSRSLYPDLPLIAGEGAEKKVSEARRLMAAARPLGDRLRGLVRMGERRWDVVLDRGQRILLPTNNPVRALERVIALDQGAELLERDLVAVDMRIAERPTLRMTSNAMQNWWQIRQINGIGQ